MAMGWWCSITLMWRAAASMLWSGTINKVMGFTMTGAKHALTMTLFGQAAVSMLGYGILCRVANGQSIEKPSMSPSFAFDIVGYSFPLAIVLNTSACLGGEAYVGNLLPMGGGLLVAATALFFATKGSVHNKGMWDKYLETETKKRLEDASKAAAKKK